jgi:hypothetical protein
LDKLRIVEPIYPAGVTVPDFQNLDLLATEKPLITPYGGTFTNQISITLETTTSGAAIRYTTDGSIPTAASPLYNVPFTLTNSATVKARAFRTGYNNSAISTASFNTGTPQITRPVPPTGLKVK